MSYVDIVSRIGQLEAMMRQLQSPVPADVATSFASTLAAGTGTGASAGAATPSPQPAPLGAGVTLPLGVGAAAPTLAPSAGSGGLGAVAVARGELGQAEQPPGSNDSPRIAVYRSAVAGSYPGAPWCAYFVSWCARQAGVPLGDQGQGLGSVAEITDWARRTGRLTDTPEPGDLILFGTAHVGIVESVEPDGSVDTIEGNSSNMVARRHHAADEATGYVRL